MLLSLLHLRKLSSRLVVLDVQPFNLVVFFSGLGFIVGSEITRLTGSWQWSLRITPILGLLCIILLSVLHSDPPRGEAEGGSHMRTTSWWLDIKSLLSNQAFMFISCGYTCVCFVLGSLSWFAIDLIQSALNAINDDPSAWRNYKQVLFCS